MNKKQSQGQGFRKDIQALRAIAVGAVLLNHLWPNRVSGGFVGVDIFFVISGFLITTHLAGEFLVTGKIALAKFYARRVKRLIPAAFLVVIVSLVGVVLFMPASIWQRNVNEALASVFYVQNWFLAFSAVDYSARSLDATAFQHYWSLSVEEQFYLFWPILIIIFLWIFGTHKKVFKLGLATSGVLLTTFIFSVWLTLNSPALAYFHTLSRAWEFLFGAITAFVAPWVMARFASFRNPLPKIALQLLALLAIAWAIFFFDEATVFPGPMALVPVFATALIIVLGPQTSRFEPMGVFNLRVVQLSGDISYSIYLWHWPLIVLAPHIFNVSLGHAQRLLIVLVTFILAYLTKVFIEDPGRKKLLPKSKPVSVFALLAFASIVMLVTGLAISNKAEKIQEQAQNAIVELQKTACFGAGALYPENNCEDPFAATPLPVQAKTDTPWFSADECEAVPAEQQILAKGSPSLAICDFSGGSAARSVWVFGDSHAEHWKAAIYELARQNQWRVTSSMIGGCPAVAAEFIEFYGSPVTAENSDECSSWAKTVAERIRAEKPDIIFTSAFSSVEKVLTAADESQAERLAEVLKNEIVQFLDADQRLYVIRDVPRAGAVLGAECTLKRAEKNSGCTAPESQVLLADPYFEAALLLNEWGVKTIDLSNFFCKDGICSGVIGGVPVFYDADHISRTYSATLAPYLYAQMHFD